MTGEIIRREAFSPAPKKHTKVERAALAADRFEIEQERLRLAGRAQYADDVSALVTALESRALKRTAESHMEMALLLRLSCGSTALAMDFADIHAAAQHIRATAIHGFGQS